MAAYIAEAVRACARGVAVVRGAPKPSAQARGQVAQMVERSPEKAGVGGSIPSLATIPSKHLP